MAPARCPLLRTRALVPLLLAAVCVCLAATPASARADATPHARELRVQHGEIAAALSASSGTPAAAVVAAHLCASRPAPGHITCLAEALKVRGTHRFLHPRRVGYSHPGAISPAAGLWLGNLRSPLLIGPSSEPAPSAAPATGTAAFLQQAYDTTWLSANAGAGDVVAIVDAYDDPTAASDLAVFRSHNGLPSCTVTSGCLTIVNQNGQTQAQATSWPATDSGWGGEETLDLAAVSALCPNCHILLVEANSASTTDLFQAEGVAAAWPGVKQLSDSWGGSDIAYSPGQFNYPGVSVLASTGDNGYDPSTNFYPAGDPHVTAVGGTSLSVGADAARGFTETAWSSGGSECTTASAQPAWQQGLACAGRSSADVSADGDPNTGIEAYDSADGGWEYFGGTSLSAPLTAAFEAITAASGLDDTTPQWAYSHAGALNDITVGSNVGSGGSCLASVSYLCNAGPGFDGPTGNGSISGDLSTGGPGIGGPDVCASSGCGVDASYTSSVAPGALALKAAVYPNGLSTSYVWEYGTSASSLSSRTAPVQLAASATAAGVVSTISGLASSTTYYYRLVATNASGTTYGYEYSATTTAGAPVATTPPAISGSATAGQTLSTSLGSWSPTPTSTTVQWQENTGSGWAAIPAASTTSDTLTSADVGAQIRALVTATNASGATEAMSAAVGPVLAATSTSTGTTSTGTTTTGTTTTGTTTTGTTTTGTSTTGTTTTGTTSTTGGGSTGGTASGGGGGFGGGGFSFGGGGGFSFGGSQTTSTTTTTPATTTAPTSTTTPSTPTPAPTPPTPAPAPTSSNPTGAGSATTPTSGALPPSTAIGIRIAGGGSSTAGAVGTTLSGLSAPTLTQTGAHASFTRCRNGCVGVGGSGASYTLRDADAGALIRLRVTLRWAGTTRSVYSASFIGPVLAARTAGGLMATGTLALHTTGHRVLAVAHVLGTRAGRRAHAPALRLITITRARQAGGRLRAWVCPTTLSAAGQPQSCTRPLLLRRRVTIRLRASGRLAVVVTR